MARTRKKDYTEKHRQTAQQTRAETEDEAISGTPGTAAKQRGAPKADHIGKRNHGSVTFTGFQELPCELRLMIWEAATTPRLVAVIPRPCPKDPDAKRSHKNREISLVRGIPALLAVNQESRHVALGYYTWRFTIDIQISYGNGLDSDPEKRRARVVMSPDDTLGLFRCQQGWNDRFWISKCRIKAAKDKRSPWRVHESTGAPSQAFKKVAILGDAVKSNLHIVRALNVTLWDLDSILHVEHADMRTAVSPHTKNKIFLESGEIPTAPLNSAWVPLDRDPPSPHVLAYELAEGKSGAKDWKWFLLMLSRPPLH